MGRQNAGPPPKCRFWVPWGRLRGGNTEGILNGPYSLNAPQGRGWRISCLQCNLLLILACLSGGDRSRNSTSLRLTLPTLDMRFKLYISTIGKGLESDMGFMRPATFFTDIDFFQSGGISERSECCEHLLTSQEKQSSENVYPFWAWACLRRS